MAILNGPADTTPIIRTSKLCRSFGQVVAVGDLDMEVRKGELFGIVGPDGAGKTTTMRMLAGIMTPTSGDAWIEGISVAQDPEAIKDHIAYMPQPRQRARPPGSPQNRRDWALPARPCRARGALTSRAT